ASAAASASGVGSGAMTSGGAPSPASLTAVVSPIAATTVAPASVRSVPSGQARATPSALEGDRNVTAVTRPPRTASTSGATASTGAGSVKYATGDATRAPEASSTSRH